MLISGSDCGLKSFSLLVFHCPHPYIYCIATLIVLSANDFWCCRGQCRGLLGPPSLVFDHDTLIRSLLSESLGRVLSSYVWEEVTISIKRDPDRRMTQQSLYDPWMRPLTNQQSRDV